MVRSAQLDSDYIRATAEEVLQACTDLRNAAAWSEFLRRFQSPITAIIQRTARRYDGVPKELCRDLVQEVYLKLSANGAKALRNFVPRHAGSAFGYVQVIAARVTHDHLKSKGFERTREMPADVPDSSTPDDSEWRILSGQVDKLLWRNASTRDRQIFWLYYRQGMSAKEIAALPALELTVKGVESAIVRLNQLVRENFRL